MIRRLIALLVAATVVLVGACSSQSPATGQGRAGVPAQLQFTATTLDGRNFAGESLLGKPAVFWFWAPWCPTCQSEAPMVGKAAAAHPAVTFVGVASASQPPAMKAFVERYPVKSLTNLADTSGAVWAKFGVTQQPAFAFLTADGHVDVTKGPMSADELARRLAALTGS